MNDIDAMLRIVVGKMTYRDYMIHGTQWINGNRNCVLITNKGTYVLKHSPQWKMAGARTKGLGLGAGMTFNLKTYLELSLLHDKPDYIMFGFPESDHVYYLPWDEFTRLSEETIQEFNGEPVRAILTKSLKRF